MVWIGLKYISQICAAKIRCDLWFPAENKLWNFDVLRCHLPWDGSILTVSWTKFMIQLTARLMVNSGGFKLMNLFRSALLFIELSVRFYDLRQYILIDFFRLSQHAWSWVLHWIVLIHSNICLRFLSIFWKFQILKFCVRFQLPVHQDGSCNGLQHYAALGRDELGGLQVNLLPTDEPQVYLNALFIYLIFSMQLFYL